MSKYDLVWKFIQSKDVEKLDFLFYGSER